MNRPFHSPSVLSHNRIPGPDISLAPRRPVLSRHLEIESAVHPLGQNLGRIFGLQRSPVVIELVEPDPLGHLRAHEARVDDADRDALVPQVQRQQLADHVQRGLGGVVPEVAAALFRVPQRDRPGLGRDEDHLGPLDQRARLGQRLHDEDRRHRRRRVHLQLVLPVRRLEALRREVARCDDHCVQVPAFEGRGEVVAARGAREIDGRDPVHVFGRVRV